ncbi:amidohydrolase family protein [Fulvivirga sedimenti]|uniref:Amidohydrolase family protein n=1 Tax=Fulvivirga sedimenti TaxID=2879465 RepID=A0A9X1HUH9_9BACT|nr:amidohydrolase family protein [Fulvivirga sedimenti]MCA6078534.1 amidohydrolase family protein [Fulvivirga sedimenti]
MKRPTIQSILNFNIVSCIILVCCLSCGESKGQEEGILISNVNIIDVRSGEILANRYVVVKDTEISSISTEEPETVFTEIIDGNGKYLLPGLAEMHAHIPSPDWGRKDMEATLFLYLSNGVTTIRGMLGHPVHLELRERAARNEILSPRIYTSSPSLNGNTVPTTEEADKKVREYQAAGYDFLKIHPGIRRDVFDVLVSTANEVGIPFAGHVPVDVGIRHALESNYKSVDHIDGFLEGLVPVEANVSPDENGFFGYNFTDLADRNKITELVALSAAHQVWIVPTQSLFDRWFSPVAPEDYLSEEEMQYMPASVLSAWRESKTNLISNPDYSEDKWERFNSIRRQLLLALQNNGHGLLLGSDAPQVFNVPGFSIHHEIEGMLSAGITPLQAIQAGTLNPAMYFGMEGKFGEIVSGASADLVLLDANPLENIENLRNPAYVIVRGYSLSRDEIIQKLSAIAESAKNE